MRRFSRTLLVVCTAFAALVGTSLQGNVLCYSEGGDHVAIELPHADTGCPDGHDEPGRSSSGDAPEPSGCTDVAAKYSAICEGSAPPPLAHSAEPTFAPPVLIEPCILSLAPSLIFLASGHPPAPPPFGGLRTIILLV